MSYRSNASKGVKKVQQVESIPVDSAKAKFYYLGIYTLRKMGPVQPQSKVPKKSLDKKSYR